MYDRDLKNLGNRSMSRQEQLDSLLFWLACGGFALFVTTVHYLIGT